MGNKGVSINIANTAGGGLGKWHNYLSQRKRTEKDYYFFSIRMIIYGISTVILSLFFVMRLTQKFQFKDYDLIIFYILSMLFVIILVFFDANRFNRKADLFKQGM